ncbi:lipopolysaccharide biosynthesis protein [Methylococcaceae bacterium WWC4]|nr:lipopolysaccharide biosynthesis protein [Methylococcaceae bacterium WWC4]
MDIKRHDGHGKKIARNAGLLYLRTLFSLSVSLFTSRVVLNVLGVEDYGVYNVVGGFVTILSFINSSMATSTQRFLMFELGGGNKDQLSRVFNVSILIHFFIALMILLLAETLGLWVVKEQLILPKERMDVALWVYQLSIITFLFNVISVPYNAAIIAYERLNVFAWISVAEVSLKLLIAYMLQFFAYDRLFSYALLICALSVVVRVAYGVYCKLYFKDIKIKYVWDNELFSSLLKFAMWNLWGNIAVALHTQGVNILLNMFFGPIVNAARGIAYQITGAINGFAQNIQTAISPQIIKSYASNDIGYMHKLIIMGARFNYYVLFLISMPLILETKFMLGVWLGVVPEYAEVLTRLAIVNLLIDCLSGTLMTSAQASGNIKIYQSVVGCVLLLILPVTYLMLIKGYPPEASIWSSIVISIVAFVARLFIIAPLVNLSVINFFKKVVLNVGLITVLSVPYPFTLTKIIPEGIDRLVAVGVSSLLSTAIVIYLIGLASDERKFVRDFLYKSFRWSER